MLRWMKKFVKKESGNVAIIVTMSMVSMLGATALVTDVGSAYMAKDKLLNALDAGALAGAANIFQGQSAATSAAVSLVNQNGESVDQVVVNMAADTVDLYRTIQIPFAFAKVLGFSHVAYQAHVQAEAGTLVSGTGFVPIGVQEQNFVYGQEYTLSAGAGDGTNGNYGYLALGGTGACAFEQNLMYGYSGTLTVGEQVETEPGVMTGPVQSAINYRLSSAGNCEYSTATEDCPRVLLLPVVNTSNVCGRSLVTIVGFSAFYLDGLQDSGGHQEIVGRFLEMVVPGTVGQGTNFGLFGVKLTQ